VRELVRRIDAFVQHDNAGARPFAGTVTADSVAARLQRLLQAIRGTPHEKLRGIGALVFRECARRFRAADG
jgi:hypothetical protein